MLLLEGKMVSEVVPLPVIVRSTVRRSISPLKAPPYELGSSLFCDAEKCNKRYLHRPCNILA